jgi:hypothetical protein
MTTNRFARRVAIEVAGWGLVLIGLAAIFLPGPGLLALFAGLAILSQQYEWAERVAGALALAAVGVFWGIGTDAPEWWPVADKWWLVGGWGTGATLIGSALIALATIVYSFKRFRGAADPEAEAVRVSTPDDD